MAQPNINDILNGMKTKESMDLFATLAKSIFNYDVDPKKLSEGLSNIDTNTVKETLRKMGMDDGECDDDDDSQ